MAETTTTSMSIGWTERTFKREAAVVLLLFWCALTGRMFFFPIAVEMVSALGTAYGAATTMIFLFAGAAFGVDAYVKQIKGTSQ